MPVKNKKNNATDLLRTDERIRAYHSISQKIKLLEAKKKELRDSLLVDIKANGVVYDSERGSQELVSEDGDLRAQNAVRVSVSLDREKLLEILENKPPDIYRRGVTETVILNDEGIQELLSEDIFTKEEITSFTTITRKDSLSVNVGE